MDSSFEHLKYCAARYVHTKQREGIASYSRWREWWNKKFDDDYFRYTHLRRLERMRHDSKNNITLDR